MNHKLPVGDDTIRPRRQALTSTPLVCVRSSGLEIGAMGREIEYRLAKGHF
jgi:hypothetical protein